MSLLSFNLNSLFIKTDSCVSLSSSASTNIEIEALCGKDLNMTMTRARFKELCGDLFRPSHKFVPHRKLVGCSFTNYNKRKHQVCGAPNPVIIPPRMLRCCRAVFSWFEQSIPNHSSARLGPTLLAWSRDMARPRSGLAECLGLAGK